MLNLSNNSPIVHSFKTPLMMLPTQEHCEVNFPDPYSRRLLNHNVLWQCLGQTLKALGHNVLYCGDLNI